MSGSAQPPSLLWRAMTLLGLWVVLFGIVTVLTPWHLEGGLDVVQEKGKAILWAPVLGGLGLAALFDWPRPTVFSSILSFGILLLFSAWILFRCRTRRAYWMLTACHFVIILTASIGFSRMIRYWSDNP
ncbi:hypothetical protein WJU23_21655 [Prosthecobacter sp. SYSU 5D2]|uniref:hypothetical protein n=1 Tax=Prosthecobacter sp. SYSU 5D2 TaxID=3134134 RepID=UPI0031FE93D8